MVGVAASMTTSLRSLDDLTLDDSLRRELNELGTDWQADPAPAPELIVLNEALAMELGIDPADLRSEHGIAILAGNAVPNGASPIAMAYAGHQFGGYSPRLGDGRALLLGELLTADGGRLDLHLKGSGRTPFARGGDGKAALGPMLREHLIAEAMHALGVPTGRALSVVKTGQDIAREGYVPGAILARVAASHLRVGTFEYAARLPGDAAVLRRLADYSIERHYPQLIDPAQNEPVSGEQYLAFLGAVVEVQAALVAQWMMVGFIHGVMNTDNTTISGETIDYGPCAFMDTYDPGTVFSSIDHAGRYAYGNQPAIAHWNLTRLAETLLPLIDADPDTAVEKATAVLNTFGDRYRHHWMGGMMPKLGLTGGVPEPESETALLLVDYVELLHAQKVDYTLSFRALANHLRGDNDQLNHLFGVDPDDRGDLGAWLERWTALLSNQADATDTLTHAEAAAAMDRVNPLYVPRNHLVEEALAAGSTGDLEPFAQLLDVVTSPYEFVEGRDRYAEPAPDGFDKGFRTFCGT